MEQAETTMRRRIGQIAAELGVNPKTIRYYEEIGLLPSAPRTPGGYRLYDEADRERLRFIAKAKAIGLTLGEIGEILAVRDAGREPCEHVLAMLDRKLVAVDQQLLALQDFREELAALRDEAAKYRHTDACICGIIERHTMPTPTQPGSVTMGRRNRRQSRAG